MRKYLLLALLIVGTSPVLAEDKPLEFNRDIRAILSENCFACHGPDPGTRKGGLRLDTEVGAKGDGKTKGAIVPGKPEDSELYWRLIATDALEIMPPVKTGKKLSDQEKALLREWISEGAPWDGHWSFIPIKKTAPPTVAPSSFNRNDLDRFILEKLAQQGMKPSPPADKVTLLRRLSFDLTGLPPTPEETQKFLNDGSSQAYEKLVDRLLASPHFGERMAVWWLDLVRYADSVGYHGDQPVSVWPFRDWVINAFNSNMPFNRFTIEQVAGDLLANATLEQKVAAGYNRLGMMSAEGGVQDKEYLAKYAAERVRNLGGAWLGTTLGCAECHDHKYDPFTMKDFYSLEAFFSDITERGLYGGSDFGPVMRLPTAGQKAELESLEKQAADLRSLLDKPTPELVSAQAAWEKSLASQEPWTILKPIKAVSKGGAKLEIQADGALLATGKKTDKDTYTLTVKLPKGTFTALRLEALPHPSLPAGGPGRAANGNFILTEIAAAMQGATLALSDPSATFEQTSGAEKSPYKSWTVKAAIDGDTQGANWGWAILPEVNKPQHAVFQFKEDLRVDGDKELTLTLAQNHENKHTLGHFRLSITATTRPVKAGQGQSLPQDILAILAAAPEKRTAQQQSQMAAHYRSIAPELAATRKELVAVEAKKTNLEKSFPTTLATISRAPRTIRLLPRGNWMDDSGPIQPPAAPASLPPMVSGKPRLDRLDLANWLVGETNPLTSRVLANRLWKLFFGQGLSRRLDDIGSQGEWPSHPELLDWLAATMRESQWDLKKAIKLMVMSGTYRQSSLASAEQMEKDPLNRWLGRQGRFRIEAEFVRDASLSISGLMVDRQGGPSVKPYQPPGYWAYLNFPTREWQKDQGDSVYRRGLYTHWQRQYLHPAMMAFDASCREECSPDRIRSNTPLQALALLNDPSAVEAARVFAEKIVRRGGPADREKITFAFQRAVSRAPRQAELALLTSLLEKERKRLAGAPQLAKEFLSQGDQPVPKDLNEVELAAWTTLARALLNLHETITRN